MNNIYKPYLMTITEIIPETYDTFTLKLEFQDEALWNSFDFQPGQFGMFSVFGAGESTFCISSSPTRLPRWNQGKGYLECTFRKVGHVTKSLANLEVGDTIGFRGPYGNSFPMAEFKGKNIVFVGGGIGLAPLRSAIWYCLDKRDQFSDITIVYGARTVPDLVYKQEIKEWEKRSDIRLVKTVDPGCDTEGWDGKVCLAPIAFGDVAPSSTNAVGLVCGPPIMIKFTLPVFDKLGFPPDKVYTTLENRMKCGLGKCGRCNVGNVYICKEGPVFTAAQLKTLPAEY
ncbi:MAG: FAD/NAD(P)-binding protein [Planctomycetota bacterium]